MPEGTNTAFAPQLFISYAREDKQIACALYERLQRFGLRPWMDKKNMLPGETWRVKIPEAVRTSDFFIALLSAQSVSKEGFVQKEYRMALDILAERPPDSVYLIPIKIGECEVPDIRVSDSSPSLRDENWLELAPDVSWSDEDIEPLMATIEKYSKWRRPDKTLAAPNPSPRTLAAAAPAGTFRADGPGGQQRQSWPAPRPLQPELMESMLVRDLPYTDEILSLMEELSPAQLAAQAQQAYDRYHTADASDLRRLALTEYFLIARHLFYNAVRSDDPKLCRRRPFVHPVHQYLSGMVRKAEAAERTRLIGNLRRWLTGRQSVYGTARDFAAFELGMCLAADALPELLACVRDPDELPMVRYYGAMALGMIGDPKVMDDLGRLAAETANNELRSLLLHVVYHLQTAASRP